MLIEWAKYIDVGINEYRHYSQLDKTLYESQYYKKLFCFTPGCNAEIKFTERRNGTKFFSTMNKQGTSHDPECPYFLNNEGEVLRRRLAEGSIIGTSVSDEHLANTVKNKSRSLKRKVPRPSSIPQKRGTTRRTVSSRQETVSQVVDNGTVGESSLSSRIRINSLNSNYVTGDYLGQRKCVFGKVISVIFNEEEGYGNICLENEKNQINAFIPPAFYADGSTTRNALNIFLSIIQRELIDKKELILICVGMIHENPNGEGININILRPSHMVVNDKQYYQVITANGVDVNPYD